jgi:hypothetical protein
MHSMDAYDGLKELNRLITDNKLEAISVAPLLPRPKIFTEIKKQLNDRFIVLLHYQ